MPCPGPLLRDSDDSERIFADELCAHRQTLSQQLLEWSQEQDEILERALAKLTWGKSHETAQESMPGASGNGSTVCLNEMSSKREHSIVSEDDVCYRETCADPIAEMVQLHSAKEELKNHSDEHPSDCSTKPNPTEEESVEHRLSFSRSKAQLFDGPEQIKSQATALGFDKRRKSTMHIRHRYLDFNKNGFVGRCAQMVVNSRRFESLCAVVILANAAMLGVASDYAMAHLDDPDHPVLNALELGFCCFYSMEVGLRIYVFGRSYFNSADWRWNWFDMALVIMSLWDQFEARSNILGGQSALKNLSFLRMLRLMKMLKLLRMVRLMRMFRELRLILNSVLGCVQAMFWAMMLILTISYMFGIAFLQACTSFLQAEDSVDPEIVFAISEYWGSIGSAMLSLYMASTAGKEWGVIVKPLREVGFLFHILFLIYIAFFAFVVMNTVTGLFLEATLAHSDKDQQLIIQMELERKGQYIDKLQAFYDEMDDDQDGQITYEEFCHHVNTPEMRAFAGSLEIDVLDAKQFFCILSDHGRRCVDVETFVVGCIKLKGAARSMDLMDLVYAHREAAAKSEEHAQLMSERLEGLEKIMKDLHPSAARRRGLFKQSQPKSENNSSASTSEALQWKPAALAIH